MATIDVGKIRFNWLGAYAGGTTYSKDDVVSYSGTSWVYVNATPAAGQTPADDAYWDIMADGSNPMSAAGDMIYGGTGGAATRLPVGETGTVLKSATATTVAWETSSGLEGWVPLGTNIPLYAHTTDSDVTIKRPWLARYNGKSGATEDYIPYDGMPNTSPSPVKRDMNRGGSAGSSDRILYLNLNHEVVHRGYSTDGEGSTPSQINMPASVFGALGMEFGGMAQGEYWVRIWYRHMSAYALTNKGNLWCMGQNNYAQLGLGDTTDRNQWVRNPYLGPDATNNSITCEIATFVPCGNETPSSNTYANCFAILHDGRVLAWGNNTTGACGIGDATVTNVPELITLMSGVDTVSINGGYNATLFMDSAGDIWSTGADTSNINGGTARTSPVKMSGIDDAVQLITIMDSSYCSAFVIQTDGSMYALGYNGYGQLGDGTATQRSTWTATGGSIKFCNAYFDGDASTTMALAMEGVPGDMFDDTDGTTIYSCGYNGYGALAQGNTTSLNSWTQPSVTTYGTSYFKNSTSADGSRTDTNMTFPRNNIKQIFPARQQTGQNAIMAIDNQDRMWFVGHMYYNYYYQAATGDLALNYYIPYPNPWNNSLASGSTYFGKAQSTMEDFYLQYGNSTAYHTYFIRSSDGGLWYQGSNTYNIGGAGATAPVVHWRRLGTS